MKILSLDLGSKTGWACGAGSGVEDTADIIKTYIEIMKGRVDDYYEHPEDYEEEE